jgi:CBS domain-containing protein
LDETIDSIVSKMAEEDVGSVVILDEERPIGLITDRDIALFLRDIPDLTERNVGELIPGGIVTGSIDQPLFQIIDLMSAEVVRRIPIVDEESRLAGIVTLDDILVFLDREFDQATDIVENQLSES